MSGFIDLHCHWIAAIDDGARSLEESRQLLVGLAELGFERVVATPHMRPSMFDNTKAAIEQSFARCTAQLQAEPAQLPQLDLGCEHYFDDVVFERICTGQGIPYPGGHAILLEFYEIDFPPSIDHLLARLRRNGLTPVIAHPERYRALWKTPETLERLLDVGACALLDCAALVGKYGRRPRRCAEQLLEKGMYLAACSDAHRPGDIADVAQGMQRIRKLYGEQELVRLFQDGPRSVLAGNTH